MTEIPYQIYAENKFFSVIDTFKSNFESKQDHGAQFCAYKNGELILDLHGGWADKKNQKQSAQVHYFLFFHQERRLLL